MAIRHLTTGPKISPKRRSATEVFLTCDKKNRTSPFSNQDLISVNIVINLFIW